MFVFRRIFTQSDTSQYCSSLSAHSDKYSINHLSLNRYGKGHVLKLLRGKVRKSTRQSIRKSNKITNLYMRPKKQLYPI